MKLKIAVTIQTFVIVGLIAIVGWLVYSQIPETEPASLNVVDGQIVTEGSEDDNYATSGEKIYLDMGGMGEMWLPVLADVPACTRLPEQHITRNGQVYYTENGEITSVLGIDVSSYQESIDWQQVKEAGIDFAFIRCAYRGYESGKLVEDPKFHENMQGAINAGIKVGVYFYSQATTAEEAREEAEMTLSMIDGYELTYPVVYDWETVTDDAARTDGISVEALTACNLAFCERVKEAGYTPMIYQNKRTSLLKLDLPALKDYDFWLAEYTDQATYYYDYRIWQYCSDGQVPGISGVVDMNICFEPYA